MVTSRDAADPGTGENSYAGGPGFGPVQLARHLGLARWQVDTARERGVLPGPDQATGRWSAALADQLLQRVTAIEAAVGKEPPVGARRAAQRMAELTGLAVDPSDVVALAENGHLTTVGEYKGWPLYAPAELDRLAATDLALLQATVTERQAWLEASLDRYAAATELGWRVREFDRVVADRGVAAGRFGRWARADLAQLSTDAQLRARVAEDRLIGPDQAAGRLAIRRTDFDYAVHGGWITAAEVVWMPAGRRSSVRVPLYRTGDVDALLEVPEIDWHLVRETAPGRPSMLRDLVGPRPRSRATLVRGWIADVADRFEVDVWAVYRPGPDVWEIDWDTNEGRPERAELAGLLAADAALAPHSAAVVLSTEAGAATRWARTMLEPGAAVILDTETTDLDGAVVEIGVIDAATGAVLLESLVDPGVEPIAAGAAQMHGLTAEALAGAPTWPQVLPQLLQAVGDRTVLAYNAEFDHAVVISDCRRHNLDPGPLAEPGRWGCVMNRRSDFHRTYRWLPLGGGHRSITDCRSARAVLIEIARLQIGAPV